MNDKENLQLTELEFYRAWLKPKIASHGNVRRRFLYFNRFHF